GLPNPRAQAVALSAAELGGGLALILGWRTRLAALALTYAQVTAIRKVHAPNGLIGENGFETSTALIAATAGLTFAGPGKIALDRGSPRPARTARWSFPPQPLLPNPAQGFGA
ncbi:MAG: DoxX family membrane protein, partial [Chloroflexota bacterium]|nr:DoxX family membrane protein [Chloroflexota bacterium]